MDFVCIHSRDDIDCMGDSDCPQTATGLRFVTATCHRAFPVGKRMGFDSDCSMGSRRLEASTLEHEQ